MTDGLSVAELREILDLLREHGWREARLKHGDFELVLSSESVVSSQAAPVGEAAPVPVAAPPPEPVTNSPEKTEAPVDGVVVTAESLGVFWRSPQPGAPPFVEVGDEVDERTPLCIVEVMKLMTRMESPVRGRVAAVHVENGAMVEFGAPLVTIVPR